MQAVSGAYKQEMRKPYRDRSFVRVTIGIINQGAQASAYVPDPEKYAYYANLKWPLENYEVNELYASCNQDYTTVDGSMYFLPRRREDVVLNQGIVTEELLGGIEVRFPIRYDIKGLTVEFGKAYPVDFDIESDKRTLEVKGNGTGRFITEEIFPGTMFLRFVPRSMVNGQSRFGIHSLTMGIGVYFDNRKIISATKRERVSPIMEHMPTVDFELVVDNENRMFDVENKESTVNFLEIGQEIQVIYGQELDNGSVEWMPGATVYLREWSADDKEMSFTATDRFDAMDGTYFRGRYHEEGISLYDLAVDVLEDAGVAPRTYWLDGYLKDVAIQNPMPAVSHKEALQLIANAGRCLLYQDRMGNLFMKSSFVPGMTAASENESYFSHAGAVLDGTEKEAYAMAGQDYTDTVPTHFFPPRCGMENADRNTGYISDQAAGPDGSFTVNPAIEVALEARYKCFGITLEFGRNPPSEAVFHACLSGVCVEDYPVVNLTETTVVSHEFPEFDHLVIEFTKGAPGNRAVLNNIFFGDSTDYELSYGRELTKTPKGTQLAKVKALQVVRTLYVPGTEKRTLVKEKLALAATGSRHTFYFSCPAHDYEVVIADGLPVQSVITDGSAHYVTVEFTGMQGEAEVEISGYEYRVTQSVMNRPLHPTGRTEIWENPLVSDAGLAEDLAGWVGSYLAADREYELPYRGEPRIDANDIVFLENKYVPDLLVRVFEHTLKFNGALSGTIKARREMGNVETAQNRLAGNRFF